MQYDKAMLIIKVVAFVVILHLISVQVDLKLREYTGVILEDSQTEGGLKKK